MAFDPSGDYTIWDGNETVTYRPKPSGSDITGVTAFREARNRLQVSDSTEDDLVGWWIPQPMISATNPKAGDQIVDADSVVYVITSWEYNTLIKQYHFSTARVRG